MVRSTGRNSSIEKILNWVECIKGIYFYTRTIPFQCKGEKCGTHDGGSSLENALLNTTAGEVEVVAGERMRFGGSGNTNAGEINNFGGVLRFDQDLANNAGGFIGGRGQFIADGGWTNSGLMFFTGTTDLLGDVVNGAGGQIVTSGFTTTTFYDDVIHNGTEIRTSAGSTTVLGGSTISKLGICRDGRHRSIRRREGSDGFLSPLWRV